MSETSQTRRPAEQATAFTLFMLAVCGLYGCSLYSYLLFHTLVEIFCVFVMLAVFLLTWNARRLLDNHYFLFLSISFITSGALELLHTFSYKGLGIFPGADANLPTQCWIAFRYVFALSLLAAPLFVRRKLNVSVALTAFCAITVGLTSLIISGHFPDCFVEGSGLTPFKICSEYVIIALLAAAMVLLRRKGELFDSRVLSALSWSIASAMAADASFTRYVSVYGGANMVGHLFLFLSAMLIYRAIVVTGIKEPAALLFRSLELSQQALQTAHDHLEARVKERTSDLEETQRLLRGLNETLELRVAERTAELEAANRRLDLIASSASTLLESDEPQRMVDELCRKVMRYLDCQAFFNYLVNEEAGRLQLNACAGISEEQADEIAWLDFGVAICGCAARDACRIVAEDIAHSGDPRAELVRSLGITAYACHPLVAQGRVLGTLSFGTRSRTTFSAEDLSLMQTVADQVAIAMERNVIQQRLRQAKQAAEAASCTKSQFLANMSHELRTPMTGVLGMLDLTLAESDPTRQREYIEMARRSGGALLRILNDILDLTKVEAGKLSLEERPVPLRGCVREAVGVLIPETRRKGIELELKMGDDLPDTVLTDQVRLRQVLTNLVGNAVKFTDQGRVEVQVTRGSEPSEIRFSVTDTGIGIPEGKRHLLFRPFSQVDDSNTRSYGGTGLGLAISQEIVRRMGGSIDCQSEDGQGSTFAFTIPLKETAAPRPDLSEAAVSPATLRPPQVKSGTRLLIAEDDATIRKVLGDMLTRMQYQVDFASDGQKAVEMWQGGDYDVILMDVQMPRLDGFQAARAIREREQAVGGRMPIIAMTAHAMKEDEQRCLAAGMDDYISKPIDFRQCLIKINALAGGVGSRPGSAGGREAAGAAQGAS